MAGYKYGHFHGDAALGAMKNKSLRHFDFSHPGIHRHAAMRVKDFTPPEPAFMR